MRTLRTLLNVKILFKRMKCFIVVLRCMKPKRYDTIVKSVIEGNHLDEVIGVQKFLCNCLNNFTDNVRGSITFNLVKLSL